MANENLTSTAFKLPTLREIFYNSELTEFSTKEYDRLDKRLTAAVKAVCKTFEELDSIDSAATAKAVEAQAIGFEQGVAFALSILGESHANFRRAVN